MAKNTPIVYLVYGMEWKQHWADTRSIIKTCMWLTAAVFLLWVVFFEFCRSINFVRRLHPASELRSYIIRAGNP